MTRPFDKGRVFCFVIILKGKASENALSGSWIELDMVVLPPFGYIEKKCLHIPRVSGFSGYYMEIFLYIPKYRKNPIYE